MRPLDGILDMLRKIINWFRKKQQPESLQEKKLAAVLEMLVKTEAHEISCSDVGDALAEFADLHRSGKEVKHLMPLVHQHLEMCPDCREEYEALLAAIDAEAELFS